MSLAQLFVDAVAGAAGGVVRVLPVDYGAAWAVVLPSGSVPILIVDYGHLVRASVLKVASWDWTAADPASTARMASQVAAAARGWVKEHPERVSLTELALDLADSLGRELGHAWTLSIPGTSDPSEMWLRPPDGNAASVGVFDQRAVIWLSGKATTVSVKNRNMLESARGKTLAAVKRQLAHYQRHLALSDEIRRTGAAVCEGLGRSTVAPQGRYATVTRGEASHDGTVMCRITWNNGGADFDVVRITGGDDHVHLEAGLAGALGWQGQLSRASELTAAMVDHIAAAFVTELTTLTIDKIVVGQRYRVLQSLQGLVEGAVVTFVGLDDIDNHYGSFDFTDEQGHKVSVTGDFSTPRRSPLGEAHRYLVPEPNKP